MKQNADFGILLCFTLIPRYKKKNIIQQMD